MVLLYYLAEKFNYYDKPDGEDPVNKIMGLAKYGIIAGAVASTYDTIMYSRCKTLAQVLQTTGYWMVPLTTMCVTFSTVTYALTNIRKKDDIFNYVIGALASGTILHAWVKTPLLSGPGTALMLWAAVWKKDKKMNKEFYNSEYIWVPEKEIITHRFSWRNLPYRDYNTHKLYPHDRESYYQNFY